VSGADPWEAGYYAGVRDACAYLIEMFGGSSDAKHDAAQILEKLDVSADSATTHASESENVEK
jgi:hypothetical protein